AGARGWPQSHIHCQKGWQKFTDVVQQFYANAKIDHENLKVLVQIRQSHFLPKVSVITMVFQISKKMNKTISD
ncbi:LOW QUALITY PROTEIN: hypothetical protein TorRG33x02_026550, partial [Trema orientale]